VTKPSRARPTGAKSVRGSDAARRHAALLLEAWSGVRSTQSAAEAMGIVLTRFYQLEARALQSLVEAMEPRPRGRQRTHASEFAKLKADKQRLSRDVERFQSLYRTSQRALGIAVAKPPEKGNTPAPGGTGKRKRGPRKRARGQAVAAELLGNAVPEGQREVTDGTAEQGRGTSEGAAGDAGEQAPRRGDLAHDERRAVRERGV
jgi:hypothetical protein